MAQTLAGSTSRLSPLPRASFAQLGAEYFGMSSRMEFVVTAFFFALLVALKLVQITRYRFDSDEPQHMHVIWGWARGFVQYRDVFDNHMPLFHILLAPIFGLIGDRPTILYWMRFILLPMYFVAAWCTYRIGTLLFSRRAGVWAVLLVGLYGAYFFTSLEFRTDNLWAPLWLLCITVLVGGVLTVDRALVAGLLLGLCFGVSVKSALFLLSILLAAPLAVTLVGRDRLGQEWPHLIRCGAALLLSTLVIPAVIMLFFCLNGDWHDFRYCVFDFNLLVGQIYQSRFVFRNYPALISIIIVVLLSVVSGYIMRTRIRRSGPPDLLFKRGFVVLVCAIYWLVLKSNLWLVSFREDYLPFYPLAFILISGSLLALSESVALREWHIWPFPRLPLPVLIIALIEIALLTGTHGFWKDRTRRQVDLLRDVLVLTEPSDYVFDCKGETIFRQRCFRPVLEIITAKSIRRGLIGDDAPQRCVETRTCVVATTMFRRLSPQTRQFLERNYLPTTRSLRVAGMQLKHAATNLSRSDFEIVIPAFYKVISREGNVSGMLDGAPYEGARFLASGSHTFESTSTSTELALLWAQAVDRNFTPFIRLDSSRR